ncbi:hypothetical protein [Listeria seeligeri]|uniref:hypothetical protein n=2 Tax=Listeria seeligeri TaxID=1640 RepID=UPI001E339599|nr:hypothetical protein [Listeria seeligeri]
MMENNYLFKEIAEKEQEINTQLEKWHSRGISAGFESRQLAKLFSELTELERLSDLKIIEQNA